MSALDLDKRVGLTRLTALLNYLMRGNQLRINGHVYSYTRHGVYRDKNNAVSDDAILGLALSLEFDDIYKQMVAERDAEAAQETAAQQG